MSMAGQNHEPNSESHSEWNFLWRFAIADAHGALRRAQDTERVLGQNGLSTTRRTGVRAVGNRYVSAQHYKLSLQPKTNQQPIAGVEKITLRLPIVPSSHMVLPEILTNNPQVDEGRTLTNDLLLEFPNAPDSRLYAVTPEGVMAYDSADDLVFNPVTYEALGQAFEVNLGESPVVNELLPLETLAEILQKYELAPQDNTATDARTA